MNTTPAASFCNRHRNDLTLVELQNRVVLRFFQYPISIATQVFSLDGIPAIHGFFGKVDMDGHGSHVTSTRSSGAKGDRYHLHSAGALSQQQYCGAYHAISQKPVLSQ